MALLFADGFDHYGTTTGNMTAAGYIFAFGTAASASLDTTNTRTGSGSLRLNGGTNTSQFATCRYSIGGGRAILNVGAALALAAPANSAFMEISRPDTAAGLCSVIIGSAGELQLRREGVLVATSDPDIFKFGGAGVTYNHLNLRIELSTTAGEIHLAHNGTIVLSVTGLAFTAPNVAAGAGIVNFGTNQGNQLRIDDLMINDDLGSDNVGMLGDKRCRTSYATSDEAGQMWTPSTGVDNYPLIAKSNPNDATYIQAANPADVSTFTLTPLPLDTVSISGLCIFSRAAKSDSGTATLAVGISTNGFPDLGDELSPGTTFSTYKQIIENNPDGDVPFTLATFNASEIYVERIS